MDVDGTVSVGDVFEASLSEDKKSIRFIECRDYYYTSYLSKEDMAELINELTYLMNLLDDSWH